MKRTTKLSFYFIVFLIFGLIGMWMPLLGDDLNWGNYFGRNYFPQGIFLKYDGRYLGDILVIAMTKFKPIAFMAYGTFMTVIVYLIQKIREQISPSKSVGLVSATLTTFFILLMPQSIFRQILGWHSGFANYVPSVIFPLFMIYLVLKNYDNKDIHYYQSTTILIFLAAIAAQLFAEHVTLLNVFNSLLTWLFLRKHFGDKFKKILNYILVGNVIGAFLMFTNGAYIKILLGNDSYRSIKGSANSETMINYLRTQYSSKSLLILILAILTFTVAVIIYNSRIKNFKQKLANFSLLSSGFIVVIPFLVVSPFGSRCMFATYIFFVAIFVINLDLLLAAYEKYLLPILILLILSIGTRTVAISHDYGKTFNLQIQYSLYQNNINRQTQYLLEYKNDDYIWEPVSIQKDNNFAGLYIQDGTRKKIAIKYSDWKTALNKIKSQKFKNHDDYLKAFDQQITKISS
ncbi:DUF6056 family protein [Companilactobacillus musae]|uniref:DUF6056 family protein n=1 Tax=Companilactobacillus musae TaxID=1903258 RepID=UPI000E646197|nr:DUF6056 family protein [Companilactobacillus musae]